jgi:hypothetical protein
MMSAVSIMAKMSLAPVPSSSTETEQLYRRLVEEQAASGLTQRAFSRAKGLGPTKLGWWKHEIARRDRLRAGASPVALLPVKVVGARVDVRRSSLPITAAPDFVVRVRSGREIRVPSGFDAGELGRLVEVLEAC